LLATATKITHRRRSRKLTHLLNRFTLKRLKLVWGIRKL
jgi:hypothetical protein